MTPITQTTAKIRAIAETDINRHISLIRMTLHKPEEVVPPLDPRLVTQDAGSFREFERTHLQAQTMTGADDSVNWQALAADEKEQLAVQPLLSGLYRDITKAARLLTTIPHHDTRCHQPATSLLRMLQLETGTMVNDSDASLSYYHGPTSCPAAAHRCSQAFELSTPWLRHHYDRSPTAVKNITLDDTKSGALLDVIKGPAGLIITLHHHSDIRIRKLCHRLDLLPTDVAFKGWDSKKTCTLSRNVNFVHDAGRHGGSRADRHRNGIRS